ncbi:hypothetical protein BDV24DRAFT_148820 [Aspergillus arachidicola]|uniref:Fucose-specific lectin n=1 Tax=Aspergillus arachidicola TaxID=656916 RepID=A0A5N6YM57_9EURO|nr:hypothetical protein BDV24DRAFT_148820 [Aspergillus arachidicola]
MADPSSPGQTSLSLTYSTELMQNYLQAGTVSPTSKFKALQTKDDQSLLFGIDSFNKFHVIKEAHSLGGAGWTMSDLSTAALETHFTHDKDAMVRSFEVWQSTQNSTIGLAIFVRSAGTDSLLVSLQNCSKDTSWTEKPSWTLIPFKAANEHRPSIEICNIWFTEVVYGRQYLAVDIDRAATKDDKCIARYYIDPSTATGGPEPSWQKHYPPVDIEKDRYQSCLGRGSPQLVYVPLSNENGHGPPPSKQDHFSLSASRPS